jgi:hypothetical protein
MTAHRQEDEIHELDEGSWAYLSLWDSAGRPKRDLHQRVIEACESSGWPAVSWSPSPRSMQDPDPTRFLEGMSHAVAHADVVIALVTGSSRLADAELDFAYQHKRPVIGLRMDERDSGLSGAQAKLPKYSRAQMIDCADLEECVTGLREVLADPGFAETIREAASEGAGHV